MRTEWKQGKKIIVTNDFLMTITIDFISVQNTFCVFFAGVQMEIFMLFKSSKR